MCPCSRSHSTSATARQYAIAVSSFDAWAAAHDLQRRRGPSRRDATRREAATARAGHSAAAAATASKSG